MPWACKACTFHNDNMQAVKCSVCGTEREIALAVTERPQKNSKKDIDKRKDEPIIGVTPFSTQLDEWNDDAEDEDDDEEDNMDADDIDTPPVKENDQYKEKKINASTKKQKTPAKKRQKKQEEEDLWGDDGEDLKNDTTTTSTSTPKKEEDEEGRDFTSQVGGIDDEGKEEYEVLDKKAVPKLQLKIIQTTEANIKKAATLFPEPKIDHTELTDDFGGFGDLEGDTTMDSSAPKKHS